MRLIDTMDGANGTVPRPMQVVAWQELL
jgi:hypothetical protein